MPNLESRGSGIMNKCPHYERADGIDRNSFSASGKDPILHVNVTTVYGHPYALRTEEAIPRRPEDMSPMGAEPARVRAHANRAIEVCLFILALAVTFSSCAESVKHDEVSAAKTALEFTRVALLEKDAERGYELLSGGGKRHVPLNKFKQTIASMHPRDYPSKVTATEYEPMSGEKAIYIFLKGQNPDEQFAYRVTLEGTAASGYRVLKIDQGMAFPTLSNQKKAFEPPLSVP